MNEHEIHETALKHVCKEIEETVEKIDKSGMTDQLLERLDKLYHVKKDLLTSWSMEHPEEYYEHAENMSGARGRSPMTGRYVSRDGHGSYTDGYTHGYSEAMNQMNQGSNSGHYPMMNPYYPDQKRW